jgi:hypothetical protein
MQFAAFRFYLQQVLHECGKEWAGAAHNSTNYVELLSRLDRWRHSRGEVICFVTFNYDTLLEDAIEHALNWRPREMQDYIAFDEYQVLKLHGSVNWGRLAEGPMSAGGDRARKNMIEGIHSLSITDEFRISDAAADPRQRPYLLFPAISIPVVSKSQSSFECPANHLDALAECATQTTHLLVIGWRAQEEHFLQIVRPFPKLRHILVVSGGTAEARETAERLRTNPIQGLSPRGEGFSEFLAAEGVLEGWLQT